MTGRENESKHGLRKPMVEAEGRIAESSESGAGEWVSAWRLLLQS